MSSVAAWSQKQSGVAAAGGGARAAERTAYIAAMKRYVRQPPHPAMYELYRGIGGDMELPMVAIENQHDGVRNAWAEKALMEFTTKLVKTVQKEDAARGLPANKRAVDFILKKYGLERTAADAHNREKHKKDAERLVRAMWDRYDATELLDVFARAEAAKPAFNRHDMADAFLLALECAVRRWTLYCKEVLPRRKRGEKRPDAAPLPDEAVHGTIRVLGIDPGTRNLGVCLVELVGMQLPPIDVGPDAPPEPLVRVLLLDLVDLKSTGPSLAVVHHEVPAAAARTLRPNYDHEDVGVLMQRAVAAAEAKKTEAAQRKAERAKKKLEREEKQRLKREREQQGELVPPPAKRPKVPAVVIDLATITDD